MTAFEKYLLQNHDKESGARHLLDCLHNPGPGSMAWDLIEKFEGPNWKVKPEDLQTFLEGIWDKLKESV